MTVVTIGRVCPRPMFPNRCRVGSMATLEPTPLLEAISGLALAAAEFSTPQIMVKIGRLPPRP